MNSPRAFFGLVWLRRNRRQLRQEDGGSMVEFALTLSVALTLIFALMQLCMALYSYGMITETAREATRWAITRGSTCVTGSGTSCTATVATVENYASKLGLPNIGGGTLTPVAKYINGTEAPGNPVQVTITYTVPVTLPFVPKNSISLSTSSEMIILQ